MQLEEVEAALRSCPLVHSTAVKAWPLPSQELGLAAYVTLASKPPDCQAGTHDTRDQSSQLASKPLGGSTTSIAPAVDVLGKARVPGGKPTPVFVLHSETDPVAQSEQQTVVSILREHLRGRLTPAAVPASIEVVPAIPLTASGKVDYAALLPPASYESPRASPLPRMERDGVHEECAGARKDPPGAVDRSNASHRRERASPRINTGAEALQMGGVAERSQKARAAVIKAFGKALGLRHVAAGADFFAAGGSSVTAAEVAHSLGVDMRWVYSHPTPESLAEALLENGVNGWQFGQRVTTSEGAWDLETQGARQAESLQLQGSGQERKRSSTDGMGPNLLESAERKRTAEAVEAGREFADDGRNALDDVIFWDSDEEGGQPEEPVRKSGVPAEYSSAGLKAGAATGAPAAGTLTLDESGADSAFVSPRSMPNFWEDVLGERGALSLTRCNRLETLSSLQTGNKRIAREKLTTAAIEATQQTEDGRPALPVALEHSPCPGGSPGQAKLHVGWRTKLGLCVDASPLLLVAPGKAPRLFIGSHAHNFRCLDVATGATVWECEVGGRVEATAGATRDGEKLAVGCYDGRIYVVNASDGSIDWTFQTGGEVRNEVFATGS